MADSINVILENIDGSADVILTDGTRLYLTRDDIEMLQQAFPGECEACGFDPNDPYDEDEEA